MDKPSPRSAPAFFVRSHRNVSVKYHVFLEMLNGPNPLTKADVGALLKRRPVYYGFLRKFYENMA